MEMRMTKLETPTVMTTPRNIKSVIACIFRPHPDKEIVNARAIAFLRTMGKSDLEARAILGM